MAAALRAGRRLWAPAVLGQRPVSPGGGPGGVPERPRGGTGRRRPEALAQRRALIGCRCGVGAGAAVRCLAL